jgi:hypothetical protein
VTGGWRKLHNEELHVAGMGEKGNTYRALVGKPEGKSPQGRPRYRWVYNIEMDLREIRVVCTGLIWLRIETSVSVMNLEVP